MSLNSRKLSFNASLSIIIEVLSQNLLKSLKMQHKYLKQEIVGNQNDADCKQGSYRLWNSGKTMEF